MRPVIIVLGDRPEGGLPTEELRLRVRHGVALAGSTAASALIFSGGATSGARSEALLMQEIAEQEGIPAHVATILETMSLDTLGNACFSGLILKNLKFSSIHVVTGPAHFERASFIFSRVLGDVEMECYGRPLPMSAKELEAMELAEYILEGVGPWQLDDLCRRMSSLHPYYSKEVRGL